MTMRRLSNRRHRAVAPVFAVAVCAVAITTMPSAAEGNTPPLASAGSTAYNSQTAGVAANDAPCVTNGQLVSVQTVVPPGDSGAGPFGKHICSIWLAALKIDRSSLRPGGTQYMRATLSSRRTDSRAAQ